MGRGWFGDNHKFRRPGCELPEMDLSILKDDMNGKRGGKGSQPCSRLDRGSKCCKKNNVSETASDRASMKRDLRGCRKTLVCPVLQGSLDRKVVLSPASTFTSLTCFDLGSQCTFLADESRPHQVCRFTPSFLELSRRPLSYPSSFVRRTDNNTHPPTHTQTLHRRIPDGKRSMDVFVLQNLCDQILQELAC